jgi:hypothetical protein
LYPIFLFLFLDPASHKGGGRRGKGSVGAVAGEEVGQEAQRHDRGEDEDEGAVGFGIAAAAVDGAGGDLEEARAADAEGDAAPR